MNRRQQKSKRGLPAPRHSEREPHPQPPGTRFIYIVVMTLDSPSTDKAADRASKGNRTVVFILSSDRSGSTWLGYILGSLRNSSFVGELRRAWDAGLRQPCAWCSAHGLEACETLSGIEAYPVDRAFEIAFSRTGTELVIDSSKRLEWARQFVARNSLFSAHLIHIIRDPRGWYESEHRRRSESRDEMIEGWVRENLEIRNFTKSAGANSTTVFYDELAASPESGLKRICDDLNRPYESESLLYWRKAHHAFAANGAAWPLLNGAPKASTLSHFISGDDGFYQSKGGTSFVDRRWKEALTETDEFAIRDNSKVAQFLSLYNRVLTAESIQCYC